MSVRDGIKRGEHLVHAAHSIHGIRRSQFRKVRQLGKQNSDLVESLQPSQNTQIFLVSGVSYDLM